MNKLIILPRQRIRSYISIGRYVELMLKIKDKFGFDVSDTDDFSTIDSCYSTVLSFSNPTKNYFNYANGIINLPPNVKLISYVVDSHTIAEVHKDKDNKMKESDATFKAIMTKVLQRSDLVIGPYPSYFNDNWTRFSNKFMLFPQFVNHKPEALLCGKRIMKLLVSGARSGGAYPLRKRALESNDPNICTLPHPGYGDDCRIRNDHFKVGQHYFKELSKYFCALATPSRLGYVVAKYMEIPAAGCLLVAGYTKDLDMLGFKDGINYIKVNEGCLREKLANILNSPDEYKDVIRDGHDLIMNNYTMNHSVKRFGKVLKRLEDV